MAPPATMFMTQSGAQLPVVVPVPTHGTGAANGQSPSGNSPSDSAGLSATPELLAFLAAESEKLESATPWEIIRWGVDHYFPKLTMATAFGPEGCVIIHMLGDIEPRVHVFNLDTGYQFKETLELRDKIAARYGIEVEYKRPDTTVEQYEAQHGGPLYKTNPDQCCADRKVKVLKEASKGWHA
ncbi:MAG TPA: phosphoadenosine phosphosulfate reductase family protein, partial [Pirellulales bacterium]